MRKEDDEDWEAEAQAAYSGVAESEFARFKTELKRKAGLLPLPFYRRVLNSIRVFIKSFVGY